MNQPKALVVVAWLFIASGIVAIISMVGSLVVGHRLNIDLTVIDLWIGQGLLRGQAYWRKWALFVLGLGFVAMPIFLALVLVAGSPLEASVFGWPVGFVSAVIGIVGLVVLLIVFVWQYRVLQRPDVRALFEPSLGGGASDVPSA